MSDRQEGLPASSLVLLATALLLFGIGGGLVGYMVGERHGEQRAAAIAGALGQTLDAHRGEAASTFSEELLHARDGIKQVQVASLSDWKSVLQDAGIPVEAESAANSGPVQPAGMFSGSTVIGAITLLCATVAGLLARLLHGPEASRRRRRGLAARYSACGA